MLVCELRANDTLCAVASIAFEFSIGSEDDTGPPQGEFEISPCKSDVKDVHIIGHRVLSGSCYPDANETFLRN